TNASQDDKPNESQIGNAIGDQEPLLKVITYRIKDEDLVDGLRNETIRRILELVESNQNDKTIQKLRLGGGFAVVEVVDGEPGDILGSPFLITKDEIDTELDKRFDP
ncbi:MAG: hypothetical protein ACKOAH_24665, partial [Pirellula sp.]